jgi:hypothetical protein
VRLLEEGSPVRAKLRALGFGDRRKAQAG